MPGAISAPKSRSVDPERAAAIADAFSETPTLKEILFSFRSAPLNFETFRDYLATQHAEESLDFWLEAQTFRQRYEAADAKAVESGLVLDGIDALDDAETVVADAKRIANEYVAEGSNGEINVSSSQRREALDRVERVADDASYVKNHHVFDETQAEVLKLMETDKFRAFVTTVTTTNLSTSEAQFRGFQSFVYALLGLTIVFLTYWFEASRFYNFFSFFCWFMASGRFFESTTKL